VKTTLLILVVTVAAHAASDPPTWTYSAQGSVGAGGEGLPLPLPIGSGCISPAPGAGSGCSAGTSMNVSPSRSYTSGQLSYNGSATFAGTTTSLSVSATASVGGAQAFGDTGANGGFSQLIDSGLPGGSQLPSLHFTVNGTPFSENTETTASILVETLEGNSQWFGTFNGTGSLQHVMSDPIQLGPSGQYTVSIGIIVTVSAPFSASMTATRSCDLPAIQSPAPGTITSNGWKFDYDIGASTGLEVKNVFLGTRPMAVMMSVPVYNLTTTDFLGSNCALVPGGDGQCGNDSRLVDFQSASSSVSATYIVNNIPVGSASCLTITEQFQFSPPVAGDHCEPSGNVGCARFYPTVSYQYDPDSPNNHVAEIELPLRLHFTDGSPASSLTPITQGQATAIGQDSNITGLPNFLEGNPVSSELFVANVIDHGAAGGADNFHQTYLPSIDEPGLGVMGPVPGCPTCVHVHWRWPGVFAAVPGFGDSNNGNPRIPAGSTQSVDVAIVAYPDITNANCRNLAGVHTIAGQPTVFWYCGRGDQDSDTFFTHGGFFNPFSGGLTAPNIVVTRGGFRINRAAGTWAQTIILTNNSGGPVTGPLALILDSLSANVKLAPADGVTGSAAPLGSPYVFAPLDNNSQLGAGQSLTLNLQFANPGNGSITYATRVLAGGLP